MKKRKSAANNPSAEARKRYKSTAGAKSRVGQRADSVRQCLDQLLPAVLQELVCSFFPTNLLDDPALAQLTDENWKYFNEFHANKSILLCLYGDGDTRPYQHFLQHLVCDDGKPLSHWVEYEEATEDEIYDDPDVPSPFLGGRCHNRADVPCVTHLGEDSVYTVPNEQHWRIRQGCPHLWTPNLGGILIRVQIAGHFYVIAETRQRNDFRHLQHLLFHAKELHSAGLPTEFQCHHSLIIGYHLRDFTAVQDAFGAGTQDGQSRQSGAFLGLRHVECRVSSYNDVLMCMGLKEDPHDSIVDALV